MGTFYPKISPAAFPANLGWLPARRKCRWQFRAGKDGMSDFDRLHSRAYDEQVFLYAYLLELNGEDYRHRPLEKRKSKLEKLLSHCDGIRFSEHLDGDGEVIFAHAVSWDWKASCQSGVIFLIDVDVWRPKTVGTSAKSR
jgi:hypothetical protein